MYSTDSMENLKSFAVFLWTNTSLHCNLVRNLFCLPLCLLSVAESSLALSFCRQVALVMAGSSCNVVEGLQWKFCSGYVEAGEKSYVNMNKLGLTIWKLHSLKLDNWLTLLLPKMSQHVFFFHCSLSSTSVSFLSSSLPIGTQSHFFLLPSQKQCHNPCGGFLGVNVCVCAVLIPLSF